MIGKDLHGRDVSIIFVTMHIAMEERNGIVIYRSEDGLVTMEARLDPSGETIWATQKAIAALFEVTVPNISYHFKKIFPKWRIGSGHGN